MKYLIYLLLPAMFGRLSFAEEAIRFHLPIACDLGTSCFIQNYVDADPTSDYHDYTCGYLSYNGHKGTDFRLPNLKDIQDNVKVLAAAAGKVRAIRDEMPDISIKKIDPSLIKDKEAGNSVAIRHGNGWETQYSHLKLGSITVKAGDHVDAGQVLGSVGLSGNTEFPHLHFTVRHHNRVIDPFTGSLIGSGCGYSTEFSLWDKSVAEIRKYQSTGILEAGFTDHIPKARPLHEYIDTKSSLINTADKIIFWVHIFGVQEGDIQIQKLIAPSGKIIAVKEEEITKNQARLLTLLGKKLRRENWPAGEYIGNYKIVRITDDQRTEIIDKSYTLAISISED